MAQKQWCALLCCIDGYVVGWRALPLWCVCVCVCADPGEISVDEFEGVLRAMGVTLPSSAIHAVFQAFDADGSGLLDCAEFIGAMESEEARTLGPGMNTIHRIGDPAGVVKALRDEAVRRNVEVGGKQRRVDVRAAGVQLQAGSMRHSGTCSAWALVACCCSVVTGGAELVCVCVVCMCVCVKWSAWFWSFCVPSIGVVHVCTGGRPASHLETALPHAEIPAQCVSCMGCG